MAFHRQRGDIWMEACVCVCVCIHACKCAALCAVASIISCNYHTESSSWGPRVIAHKSINTHTVKEGETGGCIKVLTPRCTRNVAEQRGRSSVGGCVCVRACACAYAWKAIIWTHQQRWLIHATSPPLFLSMSRIICCNTLFWCCCCLALQCAVDLIWMNWAEQSRAGGV